jgi:hypothetical protein
MRYLIFLSLIFLSSPLWPRYWSEVIRFEAITGSDE